VNNRGNTTWKSNNNNNNNNNNNENNSVEEIFLNLIDTQPVNKISSFVWPISVPALQVLPQFSTIMTLTDHHYKHDDVWDDGDDSNKCNDDDDDNVYA